MPGVKVTEWGKPPVKSVLQPPEPSSKCTVWPALKVLSKVTGTPAATAAVEGEKVMPTAFTVRPGVGVTVGVGGTTVDVGRWGAGQPSDLGSLALVRSGLSSHNGKAGARVATSTARRKV